MERYDRRDLLRRAGGAAALAGVLAAGPLLRDASAAPGRGLRALARELRGPLVTRGDPDFTTAARLFNPRFDGVRPLAIAYCANAEDVQKAIRWAKRNDVRLAARSGGHSYGGYSTVGNGLVIDVTRLSRVTAVADGRARIGAGARLIEVYTGLAKRGRMIPAGSCPTVGIAGLALGGGIGYASRKLGLTCDNVEALELVTADGRRRRCSQTENADLYWACRGGGGGNFGIVTSFTLRTQPLPTVSTFSIRWPWEDVRAAVQAWQTLAPDAPDELFSSMTLRTTPGRPPGEAPFASANGQYLGSEGALRQLIEPLVSAGAPLDVRVSTLSFMDAVYTFAVCASPEGCLLSPRRTYLGTSDIVTRPLDAGGVDTLVRGIEALQANTAAGTGGVLLDALGGAVNRPSPDETAFVHRDGRFVIQYDAFWPIDASRSVVDASVAWNRDYRAAMGPYVSGQAYQNYIDPSLAGWEQAYYGANLARLREIKRRADPGGVFRFAQSIPPA